MHACGVFPGDLRLRSTIVYESNSTIVYPACLQCVSIYTCLRGILCIVHTSILSNVIRQTAVAVSAAALNIVIHHCWQTTKKQINRRINKQIQIANSKRTQLIYIIMSPLVNLSCLGTHCQRYLSVN